MTISLDNTSYRKAIEVIDPVCGMIVESKDAAGTALYEGKIFHFCKIGCHDRFVVDPERFLTNRPG